MGGYGDGGEHCGCIWGLFDGLSIMNITLLVQVAHRMKEEKTNPSEVNSGSLPRLSDEREGGGQGEFLKKGNKGKRKKNSPKRVNKTCAISRRPGLVPEAPRTNALQRHEHGA